VGKPGNVQEFNAYQGNVRKCRGKLLSKKVSKYIHFTKRSLTHTHTHPFNGSFSRTTRVSRYQKGKTNLDFSEARGSEWQWHQVGHVQVCTLVQTDNHTSTPPLSFLQAGCHSCRPTNSVQALKADSGRQKRNLITACITCGLAAPSV